MKNKKNTILLVQFQNLIKNRIIRGKIDTPNTLIHDISLSWLGRGTDTPNTLIHDITLSWLTIDGLNY